MVIMYQLANVQSPGDVESIIATLKLRMWSNPAKIRVRSNGPRRRCMQGSHAKTKT